MANYDMLECKRFWKSEKSEKIMENADMLIKELHEKTYQSKNNMNERQKRNAEETGNIQALQLQSPHPQLTHSAQAILEEIEIYGKGEQKTPLWIFWYLPLDVDSVVDEANTLKYCNHDVEYVKDLHSLSKDDLENKVYVVPHSKPNFKYVTQWDDKDIRGQIETFNIPDVRITSPFINDDEDIFNIEDWGDIFSYKTNENKRKRED